VASASRGLSGSARSGGDAPPEQAVAAARRSAGSSAPRALDGMRVMRRAILTEASRQGQRCRTRPGSLSGCRERDPSVDPDRQELAGVDAGGAAQVVPVAHLADRDVVEAGDLQEGLAAFDTMPDPRAFGELRRLPGPVKLRP